MGVVPEVPFKTHIWNKYLFGSKSPKEHIIGSLIEVGDLTHDVMKILDTAIPNVYNNFYEINELIKNSFTKSKSN